MGLDQDDVIVRRRITRKMEFLIGDLAVPSKPDDETLAKYLEAKPALVGQLFVRLRDIVINRQRRPYDVTSSRIVQAVDRALLGCDRLPGPARASGVRDPRRHTVV